ncbi:MAG TPA: YwqG family protein [Pyrinomonadaceae bacterium]|nr:YwqG family protein [Pyrinomonadaceae bacterium]
MASGTPSRSHLGGNTNLPAAVTWPEWNGRRLDLLARISMPELQQTHRIDWLPQEGALLFFFDTDEQPWGFDPNDRGGSAVLHVPDLETPISDSSAGIGGENSFPHRSLILRGVDTFPSTDRPELKALSDEEKEAYWSFLDTAFEELPKHQLGGFPYPIQSDDMELQCQLVTHGLYLGDSTGYDDPRAKRLGIAAKDWRLLLQLDTDVDADMMWGDSGTLYFWVRQEDAAARRFQNVWTILQCF